MPIIYELLKLLAQISSVLVSEPVFTDYKETMLQFMYYVYLSGYMSCLNH